MEINYLLSLQSINKIDVLINNSYNTVHKKKCVVGSLQKLSFDMNLICEIQLNSL